ncbi:Uncharacterized protein APZ42_030936 [Daphnia magna]|uniref:Uncharacterized protein n=1 Tax=Daphnia magna TaxID=35525 RepID=A0A164NGC4_9CRUS|nr:Uncharacterized protein APZ42_030936 [Daphnia magna]
MGRRRRGEVRGREEQMTPSDPSTIHPACDLLTCCDRNKKEMGILGIPLMPARKFKRSPNQIQKENGGSKNVKHTHTKVLMRKSIHSNTFQRFKKEHHGRVCLKTRERNTHYTTINSKRDLIFLERFVSSPHHAHLKTGWCLFVFVHLYQGTLISQTKEKRNKNSENVDVDFNNFTKFGNKQKKIFQKVD